jgi:hypothetical protein
MMLNASMGSALAEILTLKPNPATSHAPVFGPRLAPKMIPTPAKSEINPPDRNEIVITETSELDCITVVVRMPKPIDFVIDSVAFSKMRFRNPPLISLNPSSSINIPKKKDRHTSNDLLKVATGLEPKREEEQHT